MKKSLPLVSCAIVLAAFMSGCNSSSKNHGPMAQKIAAISGSDTNTVLLTETGQLLGAGSTFDGALGLGLDPADHLTFTHVPVFTFDAAIALSSIKNVYTPGAVDSTSLSVSRDGLLFGTGTNVNGQMGFGKLTDQLGNYTLIPLKTTAGEIIRAGNVQGSNLFSVLLTQDGHLMGTGQRVAGAVVYNEYGDNTQLGKTDPLLNQWTPITVRDGTNLVNFSTVAAAGFSGYYVAQDGTLWVAGDNALCQLGITGCPTAPQPSIIKGNFAGGKVKHIYAGVGAAAIIDQDGNLWVTGENTNGHIGGAAAASLQVFTQLTIPGAATPVLFSEVSISATGLLALSTTGDVYATGVNLPAGAAGYTIFGLPAATASVNVLTKLNISDNGKPVLFTHVHTAGNHSTLSDENGNLWVVGENSHGELGTGAKTNLATWQKVAAPVI